MVSQSFALYCISRVRLTLERICPKQAGRVPGASGGQRFLFQKQHVALAELGEVDRQSSSRWRRRR